MGIQWQKTLQDSISIHSPYTGRDIPEGEGRVGAYISIHSPYTGRDTIVWLQKG